MVIQINWLAKEAHLVAVTFFESASRWNFNHPHTTLTTFSECKNVGKNKTSGQITLTKGRC